MSGRIVVGVDGSPAGDAALEWAAREALLREAELEVVHAEWARRVFLDGYRSLEQAEEDLLESAVRRARRAAPGVTVTGSMFDPPAGAALLRAAHGADLLVVGFDGAGPVRTLTMGSVGADCVHRARCPVVIVHPQDEAVNVDRDVEPDAGTFQGDDSPGD